jgi:hypothetical protein
MLSVKGRKKTTVIKMSMAKKYRIKMLYRLRMGWGLSQLQSGIKAEIKAIMVEVNR